jgi:hypothetical protein
MPALQQEKSMVEVVIKGIVVTHQYGTLNTGDVLRTDPEFAKHLVEDCGAATYRTPTANAGDGDEPASEPETAVVDSASPPAPARATRAKK